MEQNVQVNYTTVNHEPRKKLGLSMNEYAVADLIYNLSANPINGGWCYASKESIGEFFGLSKQSVHTIINKLVAKKLVTRDEVTKHLRTTSYWYNNAIAKYSKESLPRVKKVYSDSKESLLQDSKESLPPIYDNNKTNKEITNINSIELIQDKPADIKPSKGVFGNQDINALCAYFLLRLDIPKEDCTQKQSRQYWNLLLRESRTGVQGVRWLIDLAAEDTFYRNHITNAKDLYYKRMKLVASMRGNRPRVAVMT